MLAEQRTWGDGVGKNRPHEIEAMSYTTGVIVCAYDRAVVRFGTVPPDVAWDTHRGIQRPTEQRVVERASLATDREVEEFLRLLERGHDGLPPTVSRGVAYAADHATADVEDRLENFLIRLHELQGRCTCDTTSVWECPNFTDADTEEIDDGG